MSSISVLSFRDLGLPEPLLKTLVRLGYESPTPIQAAAVPHLLAGRDVIAQAQTGTGKTAAFALPLLACLEMRRLQPQVLVLTPTRELALQVAEAFQTYAGGLAGLHVLPIYGGQEYGHQIRALKRGVQVVVGTVGRVIDHMRRGNLNLDGVKSLVLDEADEMLRMGFIDDVDWILKRTPPMRQVALFSATMPASIRKIARRHLRDPKEIQIQVEVTNAAAIRQRYCLLAPHAKLDGLTRILDVEVFDAAILFVRTKTQTLELAEKLNARGFAAAPLNGDMPQNRRQRTVEQLKSGQLDVLVATDVAARGLDVQRISHVINYDIPLDVESYVHRIGRTGRAGRCGEAILFVTPRERGQLAAIERAIQRRLQPMQLPTVAAIDRQRAVRLQQRLTEALTSQEIPHYRNLLIQYQREHDVPAIDMAAALAILAQERSPRPARQTAMLKDELSPARTTYKRSTKRLEVIR